MSLRDPGFLWLNSARPVPDCVWVSFMEIRSLAGVGGRHPGLLASRLSADLRLGLLLSTSLRGYEGAMRAQMG